MNFDIVWTATEAQKKQSNTFRFMEAHSIGSYGELVQRSVGDPEWFWDEVVRFLGLPFDPPYRVVRDTSRGHQWATWFSDGGFNLSVACVDRWQDDPERVAIRSEKESGEIRQLTFGKLLESTERVAGALQELGVGRGDAVAVYLPMGEEAVVSLLAVARLGAMFIPVFSGYGEEAVANRLEDPKPRVLICADGFERRGSMVEMKEIADAAINRSGGVDTVMVVAYSDRPNTPMRPDRDHWWHDVVNRAQRVQAARTYAEDPVLLAYTSGTTGTPKGAVHVQAGLTVKIAQEGAFQLDIKRSDTVMWATDMGWIMGPWMVIAGLANGAAIATFDGAPNYPGP
ncbi:MAG TPA: AMP-binding protein, partial [Acidimicrobiia bacterium]